MPPRAAEPVFSRSVWRRTSLPGVTQIRLSSDRALSRAIPLLYGTVLRLEGESEWSVGRETWTSRPGSVGVKVPGEVYMERARAGPSRFQVLVFEDALVEQARAALDRAPHDPRASSYDGRDPEVRPLMDLHRAYLDDETSTRSEALEQMLAEALTVLVTLTGKPRARPEPLAAHAAVVRARAMLDARITEAVSLDELAAHARLDKFRLCRAFREEVGLPPHAYVTHRRVSLAQRLLARGVSQAEVAAQVGLYDQSQLHRHFKRIAGITPGEFARAIR